MRDERIRGGEPGATYNGRHDVAAGFRLPLRRENGCAVPRRQSGAKEVRSPPLCRLVVRRKEAQWASVRTQPSERRGIR